MGEYKDLEGQIARIETAYMAVFCPGQKLISHHLVIGRGFDSEASTLGRDGRPDRFAFYASIGELRENRPTLAGALFAVESAIANQIDDQIAERKHLEDLRATLKLPEIVIGGDK